MEETYHVEYNDPKANILLVAKDKEKFRVHDWSLKADSLFFRNMLLSDATPSEIPMPEPSNIIRPLLAVMTKEELEVMKEKWFLDATIFPEVHRAVTKYEIFKASRIIDDIFPRFACYWPKRAFIYAFRVRDQGHARIALQRFGRTGERHGDTWHPVPGPSLAPWKEGGLAIGKAIPNDTRMTWNVICMDCDEIGREDGYQAERPTTVLRRENLVVDWSQVAQRMVANLADFRSVSQYPLSTGVTRGA